MYKQHNGFRVSSSLETARRQCSRFLQLLIDKRMRAVVYAYMRFLSICNFLNILTNFNYYL